MPQGSNEAFARVKIDAQLQAQGWDLQDPNAVRYEVPMPDGTRADYVLCDRHGRSLAVVEAKRFSVNPGDAAEQARAYARQLGVPYVFLANGAEARFWDWQTEAFPRPVKTIFKQDDLIRRAATRQVRKDLLATPVDERIVERGYQRDCIDALSQAITRGQRKMLVEMATGTGKTRTAAAFIKRLFESGQVTRVLFLVDRITLAKQTEEAFTEHLRDYPCYVLRTGRRFDDAKLVTITTLQSMVGLYADYSSGYFDLVVSDECHRSIYGKWSGVLKHFDGFQVGLTATPCVTDGDGADANSNDQGDEEDRAFVRDTLRFFEVDRPTYSYKLKDAIAEGYLVPYQIYKAQTVKTASTGGFEVKRAELDWSAMDAETRVELEQLFGSRDTITVDPSALERRFTIPERNRAIVREYKQVLEQGFVDRHGVRRLPQIGKTIVFAVTKRHAETLAQLFDAAFAHLKPSPEVRVADYVVSGMGADDTVDGETKIRRFKKEPFPQILVSVNMLDTGFDCPDVVNLVFARFTRSTILYQQMRGRGTRKAKNKPVFTMFDFVGVVDYHGDSEDYAQGGVIIAREPKPGPKQPRRLLALDVDDHIDPTTRDWLTVDENGNLVRPEASEQRAAELAALFESFMLDETARLHAAFTPMTPDQERWLRSIGSQLKANAEAAAPYTLSHFAFPPFSLMGGLPQALRVFGNQAVLEGTLARLNTTVFGPAPDDTDGGPQRPGHTAPPPATQ